MRRPQLQSRQLLLLNPLVVLKDVLRSKVDETFFCVNGIFLYPPPQSLIENVCTRVLSIPATLDP